MNHSERPDHQLQVINLIARLRADPVLRETNGATQVATQRLAVQPRRRDREDQGADSPGR